MEKPKRNWWKIVAYVEFAILAFLLIGASLNWENTEVKGLKDEVARLQLANANLYNDAQAKISTMSAEATEEILKGNKSIDEYKAAIQKYVNSNKQWVEIEKKWATDRKKYEDYIEKNIENEADFINQLVHQLVISPNSTLMTMLDASGGANDEIKRLNKEIITREMIVVAEVMCSKIDPYVKSGHLKDRGKDCIAVGKMLGYIKDNKSIY